MAGPTVSVIIAAYNAMPYLTRCVSSVTEQSLGLEALEIIAVDDGSTDGTGEELDRLAKIFPDNLRVIHQPNSGGPSLPRNTALEHARGTYVFFLDADDHLGPEALERMVGMAEENGTDIVLGRMAGVGGRGAPKSMFRRNQPRTDVFSSRVYWTLNPMKLFRRALLERLGLRFPVDLSIGEDQLFVGRAYLHANGISVVADYDCVYWVRREDGGNITLRSGGTEPRLTFLSRVTDMLLENVPPGPGRDHLAHRHLSVDVRDVLTHLMAEPQALRPKSLARLAGIVELLWHEGLDERLSAMARLRLYLIRHHMLDELGDLIRFEKDPARNEVATPVLVEGGRAYARYPHFRAPGRAIPDSCYDVTAQLGVRHQVTRAELRGTTLHLAGHGYLHRVATKDVTTELVLRERDSRAEYRLPVTHTETPGLGADEDQGHYVYERAGFSAEVDLRTAAGGAVPGDGLWDISLAIGAQGLTREVRIGSRRTPAVSTTPSTHLLDLAGQLRAVTLYLTKPYGNLTLDLGERKHTVRSRFTFRTVRWAPDAPTEVEFAGTCELAAFPEGSTALRLTNERGRVVDIPVRPGVGDRDGFAVRVDVTRLGTGLWTGELRVGAWSVPLPPLPASAGPAKWRHHGLPWYAKPVKAGQGQASFALRVARTSLVRGAARRLLR